MTYFQIKMLSLTLGAVVANTTRQYYGSFKFPLPLQLRPFISAIQPGVRIILSLSIPLLYILLQSHVQFHYFCLLTANVLCVKSYLIVASVQNRNGCILIRTFWALLCNQLYVSCRKTAAHCGIVFVEAFMCNSLQFVLG